MGEPFLGEIKICAWNYPPRGWAFCDGQTLPIAQNQALFALMGTMYGGNGQTTFQLPDLRGRVPLHRSSSYVQGQIGGTTAEVLAPAQMPTHTHSVPASSSNGDMPVGAGRVLAASGAMPLYRTASSVTTLHANSVSVAGQNQAHENMQPSLGLNFCVALEGIFPSQN